ncbi:hypothetical protein QBC38DRAFT_515462 [Podospora fimiseda]|uniref:Rhodopsin domain-containing protein n=1 Tax=Podospora fimiseda TaxID=252190 RepID=A0AAN7BIV7_9PEZI|nr:hypothetical protein QBC38DRAFT_515462 [Podospora fimiseda]
MCPWFCNAPCADTFNTSNPPKTSQKVFTSTLRPNHSASSVSLTKVSVGLFLLRLTPSQKYRYFINGTIIFSILSAMGNFLTVFFQCQPLPLTWGDPNVKDGKCMPAANLKFAAFFNSSVAVLTDVTFALLPIPMLWNVQMNWRVKAAVAVILSLGLFAAISAIVKITFLENYGKHGDFLYDSSDLTIWTTIEICMAIIAASAPALRPLFNTLFDGTSAQSGSGPYSSSSGRYEGYVRDTNGDKNPTTGKGGASEHFEMYNRKGVKDVTGSEDSILGGSHAGNLSVGLDGARITKGRDIETRLAI